MKGYSNPTQPFIHPTLLPFPSICIDSPKYLSSLCHEEGSRLSSLWLSFCHYLTEQSSIASVGLKLSFRWHKA